MKEPFDEKEKIVFLKIAETLYPKNELFPVDATETIDFNIINNYFKYGDFDIILGFKALLLIVDKLFPLIFLKKISFFKTLTLEQRIDLFEKADKSKNYGFRYLVLVCKTLTAMFYFENDKIQNIVEYDKKCLDE